MPLLTRRRVIAAKIETVEGVAEVITVSEAGILAIDVKFEANLQLTERKVMLNTLSNMQPTPSFQSGKVSFKAEMKGPGASYSVTVKPALGVYLRACGFAETLVAGTSVIYAPASTGVPSLTIWVYEDGVIKKLKGCRGTVKFSGNTGEAMFAEFEFQGVFDNVVDGALITPTFESTVPPILIGTSFTVDSFAAVIKTLSIDMGNKLALRPSMAAPAGYLSAMLTDRNPTGKIDPEATLVASYDWFGKLKGGTAVALNTGSIGSVIFNKYAITAPKLVYTQVGEGDRESMITNDLTFALAMNTGDDEISIAFT